MWTKVLKFTLQSGVRLSIENDEIIFIIPVKEFDHEICDALASISEELVYDFEERAGIIEFEANVTREKAQEQALVDIISSAIHEL